MFLTKIISFNSVFYSDFADKVLFNVNNIGQVGILTHHIESSFLVVPSICYVFYNDQKHIFYLGYGFAKFVSNELLITSNIVSNAFSYQDECLKFGKYGEICKKNFKRILL